MHGLGIRPGARRGDLESARQRRVDRRGRSRVADRSARRLRTGGRRGLRRVQHHRRPAHPAVGHEVRDHRGRSARRPAAAAAHDARELRAVRGIDQRGGPAAAPATVACQRAGHRRRQPHRPVQRHQQAEGRHQGSGPLPAAAQHPAPGTGALPRPPAQGARVHHPARPE
nr:C653 [uncultured bacterium]